MDVEMPAMPEQLPDGLHVDVCVVGAGIAGLSTAYQLARSGAKVIVLDEGPIGRGETGRTSAHLSNALDDRYEWLERVHGADKARLAAESHTAAIDCIEAIARQESIECGFARVDGFLFSHDRKTRELDRELAAAERAGVAVERTGESCFSFFDTGPCLRFRQQAIFHPLRYLDGLARAIPRWGGAIFTGHRVIDVESGAPCRVLIEGGKVVHAERVVVATNVPVHARFAVHTKQVAHRSYVIAVEVPAGSIPNALFWDTADPYHYARLAPVEGNPDLEHLIVGGEDHRTGQADDANDRWRHLAEWTRARFPMAGAVARHWSGQIIEPVDGLAYIGRSPGLTHPAVFIATGDSGNGLTHGTIAGMLLRDLIVGRENPWADVYDPGRVLARTLPRLVGDTLRMAAQYGDWFRPGETHSYAEIAPGCGAVIRRGLKPIAVYRDDGGAVIERSAVCPHLGGVVSWNAGERTWDCPCHGSRFDRFGHVLNGPANKDLAPVEPEIIRDDRRPQGNDREREAPERGSGPSPRAWRR
jgi:glycine/D-amino acid oxidase-like deaminating enzyme/nitrite reductase/ring-hydroxylating ferredoxin subunit